jgi:hypothetical protein
MLSDYADEGLNVDGLAKDSDGGKASRRGRFQRCYHYDGDCRQSGVF